LKKVDRIELKVGPLQKERDDLKGELKGVKEKAKEARK